MKNYKFLILGSNGLLGSKIVRILKDRKIRYLTVARTNSDFNLDLKNYDKLEKFFLHKKFDILINCAAIVNIDFCEKNYNDALIINAHLVKFLAKMSKKHNFKLIQISTDHVYAGCKKKLNSEKSKIFGVNNYAKSKILGEKYLADLKKYLIVRTNFTGKKKNSFIDFIIKNLEKNKTIYLFDDMYTSTLDVSSCAKVIIDLSLLKTKGIYNVGSRNMISKKKFAIGISKIMKKKIRFKCLSANILDVPRGKNLGLNVKKVEKTLGIRMQTSAKSLFNLVKEYK